MNPGGNCLGARVHTVGADGKYVRGADKGANPERGDYKFMTYQQVYFNFYIVLSGNFTKRTRVLIQNEAIISL